MNIGGILSYYFFLFFLIFFEDINIWIRCNKNLPSQWSIFRQSKINVNFFPILILFLNYYLFFFRYNIVLQTQADVVAVVKPNVTWTTLNQVARENITRYLLYANLITGEFDELVLFFIIIIFLYSYRKVSLRKHR